MHENKNPKLVIAGCKRQAAEYAVKKWHYSQTLPAGKLVTFGIWENDTFVGSVIYGRGANPYLIKRYGLKQDEGCELVRVALSKHQTPTSKIVATTLKILKKRNGGLRLIVSFADTEQGHKGVIYQAMNWMYTGSAESHKVYFVINGKRMHPKSVHSRGWSQSLSWIHKYVDPNAYEEKIKPKHRYLYPLDKAMRKQIEPLAQPYPKK